MAVAELNYRLRAWTPTGSGPRVIDRDGSFILGGSGRGLRLQVEPEGECREAVFSAKGDSILIPPLSAVQVEYLHSGIYVPVYFGEVRRGGNGRDVYGEDYTLRGMSRRFEEITLSPGFTTPEQPAHLTVRAIAQDVIGSGQLGTPALVQYVESLIPDLGFNCRAVKDAAQQNPAALLKQIAEDGAKYGVIVRWGVDPQRRFFCRPAKSNTRDVTAESPVVRWQQPVAETPCTAVLWYAAKYQNGRPITHLSTSAEASIYGTRIKPMSAEIGSGAWRIGNFTAESDEGQGVVTLSEDFRKELWGSDSKRVSDYDFGYGLTFTADADNALILFSMTLTENAPFFEMTAGWFLGSAAGRFVEVIHPGFPPQRLEPEAEAEGKAGSVLRVWLENLPSGTVIRVVAPSDPAATNPDKRRARLTIFKARPEVVNTAVLDGLAAFHYVSPAQEPADIQTSVFVPPVDLPGRVRVEGAAVGAAYEQPLEAIEYRITSNGMQMGWMAGQADDPAALAQASLIRKRDGQAVITALTSQT